MKITIDATEKEQKALAAAFGVEEFADVENMLSAMLTMAAISGKSDLERANGWPEGMGQRKKGKIVSPFNGMRGDFR